MDASVTLRQALLALLLSAVAAAGVVLLLVALGPDWSRYAPATCTTTRCFCETARDALIVQPANSWSSFGYVLAGFLMILSAMGPGWSSAIPRQSAVTFGVTAIVVGVGSVLLHATLTLWGQFFDVLGMYLIGSFMLVSALSRWRDIPVRQATILYVLLCAALVAVLLVVPELRRFLFAGLLLTAIAVELIFARPRRAGVRLRYYFGGMAATAVAFTIWNLDQHLIWCAPDSLLQGHAVWHLLGACSVWLSFSYYRSERPALARA